ncbi:MAG: hypothetical protein AAF828_03465 [Bacteroidota bacterium]
MFVCTHRLNWFGVAAVLLLGILQPLLGQQSLYDDVQLLRQVEARPNPTMTLKFQRPDSIEFIGLTYYGNFDLPLDKTTPIPINYQGSIGMTFYEASWGDSIIFTLPDTTLRLAYPMGMDTSNLDEEKPFWDLNLRFQEDETLIEGNSDTIYAQTFESFEQQVNQAEIILFGDEITRRIRNRQYRLNEEEMELPLLQNPFLGRVVYGKRNQQSVDYFPPIGEAQTEPQRFLETFYERYPYQRFINGDSLLDFRRNLSLTTTASSYRSQIVTAQKELQSASATVEANRKKSGALNAQAVAVGLSDFIAERAQEELNLTFFNRFKENLARDSELTVLFPATRDLMYKFEISNYKTFLNYARKTFQNDLDNLSLNLPGILDLPKYKALKDDPNVFNLSLIYNVADLAYRQVPVENILLASLQQLQQRRDFLNQSINLAITDSTLNQQSLNNGLLADYRNNLAHYLNGIEETSQYLSDAARVLDEPFVKELRIYNRRILDSTEPLRFSISKKNIEKPDFQPADTYFRILDTYEQAEAFAPISQIVDLRPTQDTATIDFTSKYLSAKLEGRDFHLFRLERDQPEDFESYYLQEPLPAEENILAGLDASREILEQAYDNTFDRTLDLFYTALDHYQITKTENQREEGLTPELVLKRGGAIYSRYNKFYSVLEQELAFWQQVTGKDQEDHFIGGLAYVKQQFKRRWRQLNTGYLSGFYEVTTAWDNYSPDDQEYLKEFNLYFMDDNKLDSANLLILGMHDVIDVHYQKFLTQRQRVAAAFDPRFSELAPLYSFSESLNDSLQNAASTGAEASIGEQYASFNTKLQGAIDSLAIGFSVANEEEAWLQNEEINDFKEIILPGAIERVGKLHQQRRELEEQLAKLERTYAGNLVDARRNAADMSTIMAMTSQLVFALRTYDHGEDQLYYQDTQRVEIVRELIDGQLTKDSLIITELPVPGTDEGRISRWISREEFDALRKDDVAWNLYLGLLYQRLSSVEGGEQFSPEGIALMITKVFELISEIDEQRNNFRRKKAANVKSITFKDYYPFIRSSVDLFNTVITTPFYAATKQVATSETEQKSNKEVANAAPLAPVSVSIQERSSALSMVPIISNEALSLYENIFVKNYGSAVLNATELMKILTARKNSPVKLSISSAGAPQTPLKLTKAERKAGIRNTRGINAVFRYGAFMASMIDARTSDQVRNILRATTLPPGSSRIKREVVSNVTINSYLGAALGRDRLLDAPADLDADAFGAALSVPIGITYSFSPRFLRNNSSFSIHVPLLDLGAITAYRSNPSGNTANVNNLPELEWKNLFSPGAYFIYNFADSPFSVGVGGQYGPQLREIIPESGDPLFLNSWRFPMVFFSIDVPFYNLHTGARKIVVR